MADEEHVEAAVAQLDDELRKLGLYVEHSELYTLADGRIMLVCEATIGDIAFSTRVQDPEQHHFDQQFRTFEVDESHSSFEATREDLRRRLAEGKPIFGDDE